MAGDPIYDCCNTNYSSPTVTCTCSSSMITINSTSDTYYASHYVESRKPKKTKKQLQQEKAETLHKLSFLMMNEVRPNVFKTIGYPMKRIPKPYHKNYALH